jgi:hypothetical protein
MEAHVTRNAATGWTFFWVQRTARPLPVDANVGPEELGLTRSDGQGRCGVRLPDVVPIVG